MTTRELLTTLDQYWWIVGSAFVLLPLLAVVLGLAHGRGKGGAAPWKYLYGVLVYTACVPGLFAAVVTGYTIFFIHENLLDVNPVVYFGPIAAMVVTLLIINKQVRFIDIPGFDRLAGLMVMIACSFALMLAVERTHLWLLFHGSIWVLFALAAGIFALIKWGAYMLFRRPDEPEEEMPKLPLQGG